MKMIALVRADLNNAKQKKHSAMNVPVFKGLKVVELASVLAGPAVGMFFAELGASVIKIENARTNGDVTRRWKGPTENLDSPYSAYYHSINWGKTSLLLDLTLEADRQTALEYILEADILISNFKKGGAARLGMEYAYLQSKQPGLIQVNLTGYGEEDPTPAFDIILQAETGYMHMTGHKGSPVARMPVALIDLLAAHQMKEALLIGLLERSRTGEGCYLSVSLAESALASLANQASNWLNAGLVPEQMGTTHPNIAPYGDLFTASDGKQLVFAVGTEGHFRNLCKILDLQWMMDDDRFKSNAARVKNREDLVRLIQQKVSMFASEDLLGQLRSGKVPVGTIRNMKQVFELPLAKDLILTSELPGGEEVRTVRTAVFRMAKSL